MVAVDNQVDLTGRVVDQLAAELDGPVLQPHFELVFCVTWADGCSLLGREGGRPGCGGRGGSGVARGVGGGAGGARGADRAAVFPAGAAGTGADVPEGPVVAGGDP